MSFPSWLGFVFVLHFVLVMHSYHVIMCIAFAYVFVLCIRAFPPLSVSQSDTHTSPGVPFCLFSCAGVKLSRNGQRFAKRSWYTTGRPPVKFRAIWRPFDTSTVNQGKPYRPRVCCSPTPLRVSPQTHPNPLHPLGHSITIVWAKTALHLDTPTSS